MLNVAFALLSLVASGPFVRHPNAPRPIVLTTDCGADMDDQWALAHLALSREFDLRCVVTTHAPNLPKPAAEASARVAREVLHHLPLVAAPDVVPGSSEPLADRRTPRSNSGVERILAESQGFSSSNRLAVLVIGAATDAASALLIDRTLQDRIEIVAMGFLDWPSGGREWNIQNDVKAWQAILDSSVPVTLGDQAVCKKHLLMTRASARALWRGHGPSGDYLAGLLVDHIEKNGGLNAREGPDKDYWPIWDSVTVAHLMGLAQSKTYPRPSLSDDLLLRHPERPDPKRTIRWIVSLDEKRLWADFVEQLERARRQGP